MEGPDQQKECLKELSCKTAVSEQTQNIFSSNIHDFKVQSFNTLEQTTMSHSN